MPEEMPGTGGQATLPQTVFFGIFGYLAAYLMQTYHLPTAATAIPLALAGMGVIVGSFLGGRVADHHRRLALFALSCWGSGLLAALVFMAQVSPWVTVALAFGAAALARISSAVTPTLLLELADNSRTTATGLFTVSNQLGVFGGASLGGLMLALGGFPRVGLFCLGGVGHRCCGDPTQGKRLGRISCADCPTEGHNCH